MVAVSDVGRRVRKFYEAHPYPSQRVESEHDLVSSGHEKVMQRILSTAGISATWLRGKRILDGGCGTGEKAIYCSLHGAEADAFDFSRTSIKLAKESAKKLKAKVNFKVADFESVQLKGKYDLLLLIGTLHHTDNPKGNFLRMAKSLAPGARIVLGLYNVYGRLSCRLHRKLLWAGEKNPDRIIAKIGIHEEKSPVRKAALADRFASPHETYHSIEEVLRWFSETGIAPIATHPKANLSSPLHTKLSQFSWLLKSKGLFFIAGEKK